MNAKNYHNETVTFTVGQTVTHVTDDGEMINGTVNSVVAPDCLDLIFEDGNRGTEQCTTCF